MSYQVKVRQQVMDFAHSRGMEHRRALKKGILALAKEQGDIKALREQLSGYYRLRISGYRVIFRYLPGKIIECVYVEERKLVYEIFESEMARIIGQ